MTNTETLFHRWIKEMKQLAEKGDKRAKAIMKDYETMSVYRFREKYTFKIGERKCVKYNY